MPTPNYQFIGFVVVPRARGRGTYSVSPDLATNFPMAGSEPPLVTCRLVFAIVLACDKSGGHEGCAAIADGTEAACVAATPGKLDMMLRNNETSRSARFQQVKCPPIQHSCNADRLRLLRSPR